MMTKHTPGPYRLLLTPNNVHVRVGRGALEYDWSQPIYGGDDADEDAETIATARLMAAAPDLLAACQALLPEGWDDGTMDHMPGIALARAAIAKATN